MKVHAVANFKLKRLASLVGIALLSGLGNLQVGLDVVDYLLGLNDKIRAKIVLSSSSIQFKGVRHRRPYNALKGTIMTLLITVVIRELSQW
jgi:hypothetical protein